MPYMRRKYQKYSSNLAISPLKPVVFKEQEILKIINKKATGYRQYGGIQ
jgi:hypothetical protein